MNVSLSIFNSAFQVKIKQILKIKILISQLLASVAWDKPLLSLALVPLFLRRKEEIHFLGIAVDVEQGAGRKGPCGVPGTWGICTEYQYGVLDLEVLCAWRREVSLNREYGRAWALCPAGTW